MSRIVPPVAQLAAAVIVRQEQGNQLRHPEGSSRINFGPRTAHTTLTSALSPPRRHHNDPDIAMLPALRRVAPRITKTAVNARALSKGTMDMRGGLLSNPKLGIIRLDYDYIAAPGDIDHPGSFPCGTAWSKATPTGPLPSLPANSSRGSWQPAHSGGAPQPLSHWQRVALPAACAEVALIPPRQIGDFGLKSSLLDPSRRGGLPRRAGPLVRDGPGGH